ncbi:bel1-like homeodomain protein 8 [Phtheirospermum japonicum]|uniref:Bel1-like homeodomain protein 8 n=1 Tax=Phtheirospermum japonicum TaxID=374723 RepID=A0A830D2N1_9LAMI|nr:bel1-like homeodomain protein 8 [Phtheirospermum japonicum]
MDMNTFRPEIHVAQQSRRDKLRFHNASSNPPNHHFGVYDNSNNMNNTHQQLSAANLSYVPSEFCPEINNFNHPSDTVINRHDPQSYFSTWKSIGSQSTTGNCWVSANSNITNQTPGFVGEGQLPCSSTALDVKPYTNLGYQDLHSSQSSDYYHSALQELVSTSSVRSFVPVSSLRQKSSEETSHGPWVVNGGELLLLPAYADHLGLKGPDDFAAAKENSNAQALSLSLSSVPSPKVHETQVAERDNDMVQDFRIPKITGNARQDVAGTQVLANRNLGPLGPFTGYATILKSSKFLRPAQILLEELCGVGRPKNVGICEEPDKVLLEEIRVSGEGVGNGIDPAGMKAMAGDSSGWMDSYRPENLQKKAKLLYMQDEVYKKYKQYNQQMQMVVSSFESVAGLSASTPYVSLALKMVSKHFRCLKNVITDQLKSIRNALGEELLSPSAGTSGSKGEAGVSMLKFFDQSFQKQKGASNNLGINLDGQNIWRPQRGLPERAVSILRAWLFDHFLHPYPTDTDKHMLATQTGLTRNQVSNWFINARVRVWKPMVEEIHMLETKGMVDTGSDGKTTIADCDQANYTGQCSDTVRTTKMHDSYSSHLDPSEHTPDRSNPSTTWNQEKRSRIDYHVPTSVFDGSSMGFVPSHHSGVEMAGMGAVSLTLGLRQSAENGQRQPLQPEHHRLRQHYGGQIIRDFVG